MKRKFSKIKDNFEWYTNMILDAELLDYSDVKGCYIMRPAAMSIWNNIKDYFNIKIKELGVKEAYFPMLIPQKNLEIEKDHLSNFSPEVAWITHCGDKKLEDKIAIRPTSETTIYPLFSKWLKTYRDLPYKINQWCSVLRWEVKSCLFFIRGREFLWQEGHTCFYLKNEAEEECKKIQSLYESIYTDLLAIPCIKGKKTELEKFGGADYTLTVESFIPVTGRGIQAATSHHLGQNFSKMFNISVDDENKEKSFVYQNCWGITTRSIGIAAMIHSDDRGFVCPPFVAEIQAVIVLCGIKSIISDTEITSLKAYQHEIFILLNNLIRVKIDLDFTKSPGFKYNQYEKLGVPIRIDVGFKEMENREVVIVRRDTGIKKKYKINDLTVIIKEVMQNMHDDMYSKALKDFNNSLVTVKDFNQFDKAIANKKMCYVPLCLENACEEDIGNKTVRYSKGLVVTSGAKALCIPYEQKSIEGLKCISCLKEAKAYVLMGRSY